MTKGQLILTPGLECGNRTTVHYSVYVQENAYVPDTPENNKAIFTHANVAGALFLQQHMMYYCKTQQRMIARDRQSIRQIIQTVKGLDGERLQRGLNPLICAFDAEPAPVQARRYFDQPADWPSDEMAQAELIYKHYQGANWEGFLSQQIDQAGYYPLLPSNQTLGQIAVQDVAKAQSIATACGVITGRVMADLGINCLYAPVCDLRTPAFPERCYSDDRQIVTALAEAWCLGALSQKGIEKICLKHAPGHGVEINQGEVDKQDTHNSICVSTVTRSELDAHMQVFVDVARGLMHQGIPASAITVMTNHIMYTALDAENPVSSSSKAIDYIQQHCPQGVELVSDCVHMASFASDATSFFQRLQIARNLHRGGVIATTHFVKLASRMEMLAQCETQAANVDRPGACVLA